MHVFYYTILTISYFLCYADAILSVAYNPVEAKRDQFATTGVDGVVKFWTFTSAAGDSGAGEGQACVSNGDMMII